MSLVVKLNTDRELVKLIKLKVKNNNGHCPCRIDKTEDTKCPCKEFREQDYVGECHCGLYRKVEEKEQ